MTVTDARWRRRGKHRCFAWCSARAPFVSQAGRRGNERSSTAGAYRCVGARACDKAAFVDEAVAVIVHAVVTGFGGARMDGGVGVITIGTVSDEACAASNTECLTVRRVAEAVAIRIGKAGQAVERLDDLVHQAPAAVGKFGPQVYDMLTKCQGRHGDAGCRIDRLRRAAQRHGDAVAHPGLDRKRLLLLRCFAVARSWRLATGKMSVLPVTSTPVGETTADVQAVEARAQACGGQIENFVR